MASTSGTSCRRGWVNRPSDRRTRWPAPTGSNRVHAVRPSSPPTTSHPPCWHPKDHRSMQVRARGRRGSVPPPVPPERTVPTSERGRRGRETRSVGGPRTTLRRSRRPPRYHVASWKSSSTRRGTDASPSTVSRVARTTDPTAHATPHTTELPIAAFNFLSTRRSSHSPPASAARDSSASRSSGCENIWSDPSAPVGHSALGLSRYNSSPLSSGSRR